MKKSLVFFLFISFLEISSQINLKDSILLQKYQSVIKTLADDSLYGRPVGSVYEEKAAAYINSQLLEMNLALPMTQKFDFKLQNKKVKSKNLYCYLDNHSDSTILLGAHYDHLEMGSDLSFNYSNRQGIHNGADDNASGVALLLGLAMNSKNWMSKYYNYIFVAYSAHEIGLFGSEHFSKFCEKNKVKLKLVLNFDMVGRLDSTAPVLSLYAKPNPNELLISDILQKFKSLKIDTNESEKVLRTDCKHFASKGIPCLSFTSGLHSDYHKTSDDEEKINYQGLLLIQKVVEEFLFRVD